MSMDVRKVKLDFNRTFQYDIPSVQGDTGRSIEFQIMDGSVAEDITGETVKIFGLKPDGFRVFNNATITDALNGKCTVDLTLQMLCVAGTVQCTLVRYKSGEKLSSMKFNITVAESVADDIEIESTNEYLALTGMFSNLENEINSKIDELVGSGELANMTIQNNSISAEKYQDQSVTLVKLANDVMDKIDLTKDIIGNNLFNKEDVTDKYYVDIATGELVAENSQFPMSTSNYITVEASTAYTKYSSEQICYYDKNKNFISGEKARSFTTPATCKYIRISCNTANKDVYMLNKGTSLLPYESYSITRTLYPEYLPKHTHKANEVEGLEDINSLKEDMSILDIQADVNKFNKETAIGGQWMNTSTGELRSEISGYPMTASDFIKVDSNSTYTKTTSEQVCYYDENKTFISGVNNAKTFTTPATCKYVRISFSTDKLDTYMLNKGSELLDYVPYKKVLGASTLPSHTHKKEDITGLGDIGADEFYAYLPKEFCIAKGTTLEIYNKQVCHCGNIDNFHFNWKCPVGIAYERKLSINTTLVAAGNYSLTLEIYNNNLELIKTLTSTIKVIAKGNNATVKKVMCIGDSLTDISYYREELKNLMDTMYGGEKIKYIGTKGSGDYKHEGYSGWWSGSFLADSSYTYGANIILTVSGVTTKPASKKLYKITDNTGTHTWEVEKCELTGGSGKIYFNRVTTGNYTLNNTGTITAVDSTSVGDASINYSSWEYQKGNPFWNSATNAVDFANYLTENNLEKPDTVIIFLGANDVNRQAGNIEKLQTAYSTTSVANIKTLVDKILSSWTNTNVLVVLTPYYSNQDGAGKSFPNSDKFYLHQHARVYALTDLLNTQFKAYNSLVKIVPVAQCMDSDNVFGRISTPINPRMTDVTVYTPKESTHPVAAGFYQMADVLFGALLSLE